MMDLLCYLHPGWEPLIRPAEATRPWMDATPESFAYRCLPLNIANAHGWEILTPVAFDACWSGGGDTGDVTIRLPAGTKPDLAPVSIFGQGVLTFHIFGLFRTPPGWNLWVGGSPNRPKDGIFPLAGVIETDWSPYTFTMNWRFTRPGHWVRFDAQEPICFIFPVQRGYLEEITPKLVPMEHDRELMRQFKAWSASRDSFQARVAKETPAAGTDKWQKRYYRGIDMTDRTAIADHQIKPRLKPFVSGEPAPQHGSPAAPAQAEGPPAAAAPSAASPPTAATLDTAAVTRALQTIATDLVAGATTDPLVARLVTTGIAPQEARRIVETARAHPLVAAGRQLALKLRKRDWLLDVIEKHQQLRPSGGKIERRAGLSSAEFLERYYAANRPVILLDEMSEWPALGRWTARYLRERIGGAMIEYQGDRTDDARFEMYKDAHRREMAFDAFIDLIMRPDAGNDAYMTAYNSARNASAIAPLHADLGTLDKFLAYAPGQLSGMIWIGPAGTVTSLHHDLTNNLIAQVVGRKRLRIVAAADVARIYNHHHVFSEITDLDAADLDRHPALRGLHIYDVTLSPGEIIFMPIGWWHEVRALDFSVTMTYTNFHWPNDLFASYPLE
jgi:hypothetical protein